MRPHRLIEAAPRWYSGAWGLASKRVVRVKSWSELPETLEPGVYEVDGRAYTILARVSKRAVVNSIRRAKKSGTRL